jgi:hypothetical protein
VPSIALLVCWAAVCLLVSFGLRFCPRAIKLRRVARARTSCRPWHFPQNVTHVLICKHGIAQGLWTVSCEEFWNIMGHLQFLLFYVFMLRRCTLPYTTPPPPPPAPHCFIPLFTWEVSPHVPQDVVLCVWSSPISFLPSFSSCNAHAHSVHLCPLTHRADVCLLKNTVMRKIQRRDVNIYVGLYKSRGSVVGIATGYGLDDRGGRTSRPGGVSNFHFSILSRPTLGPI